MVEVATAAMVEVLPKPPGASSVGVFDKSLREISGWNDTKLFFLFFDSPGTHVTGYIMQTGRSCIKSR
jgi:hypothetical protein